ncbi:hypothetical protein AYO40_05645 [Planctomycetaceae bacterium SCGC AG-212-D15]|nr:hypothetical protein AYO40_05645 [Planctomycetaceae bacterium SCGC AG-212-D15]
MELLWPFLYLSGAVLVHAMLVRLPIRGNSVAKYLGAGGAAALALTVHLLLVCGPGIKTFAALALFAFVSELYIFLFTMVASSVSVRLLLTLREGSRTTTEIDAVYDSSNMVQDRIGRLLDVGLLVRMGDSCRLSPQGERLLRTFSILRQFFRHSCPRS